MRSRIEKAARTATVRLKESRPYKARNQQKHFHGRGRYDTHPCLL
jgi:hypothetical protein